MTQLISVLRRLSDEDQQAVKNFAESLLAKHGSASPPASAVKKISFEGWAGCLAHVHPEMSDKEFSQLMLDEWTKSVED